MIATAEYETVRSITLDEYTTLCSYLYWRDEFKDNSYLLSKVEQIAEAFDSGFTRDALLKFFRSGASPETKFIAAMIWGHEAPAGSRRDSRGPWKLAKMFRDVHAAEEVIRGVRVSNSKEIVKSYKALDRTLDRCGPNFFTKYFYFLGKAQELAEYPLILDDRVARGIAKVVGAHRSVLEMIRVSAQRTPGAYLRYLRFAHNEAREIGCAADKVEYYLFTL